MLFISHLVLVLSIIFGLSYTRYQSDWETKLEYLADLSASHLSSHNTFFSGSVAGRNHANLLMQSTLDNLKAIPNLQFLDVQGVSDYSSQPIAVRYDIDESKGWRLDVSEKEVEQLSQKIIQLKTLLAKTSAQNSVYTKKLNQLINKTKVNLDAVNESIHLQSLSIPELAVDMPPQGFYLDESAGLLFVQIELRNENGGRLLAIFDAVEIRDIKLDILFNVVLEAFIAIVVSFVVIYLVTLWLVSPLKSLASSMKQDIDTIDQTQLPELTRADEIGDLARSYASLITKINNQLRILRNQTETDPLTGLGSRLRYQRQGPELVQASLAKGHIVYIVMCDIDNFKRFNDTYGHTEGDNTLAAVANALGEMLTENDLGCRMGGEEFVFILQGQSESQLLDKIEALRNQVQLLDIAHVKNPVHNKVTVTVGATAIYSQAKQYSHEQSQQLLDAAVEVADQQLYLGKENGRNRVMIGRAIEARNIV
ncbi:diguanylate cyclase [Vibrio sp. SCSIO 43136]|nr:diguanylate cyclase [Vibrio sp. SCSIO 43136]